jgi:ATP-binding cassette subfamily F protein uup
MDEPTNDLDVETLELLEELLGDYAGTLLLVSHDRDFLDRVVTSTLVMEGEGRVGEYVGGYSDWIRQRAAKPAAPSALPARHSRESGNPERTAALSAPVSASKRRLSYKEQKELEQLPASIERLESKVATLTDAMHDPTFYQRESTSIVAHNSELAKAQAELDTAYTRWMELDAG